MATEARLTRVENKIDKVSDDVIELKSDMKHLMPKIEEHITGDKKIINEIIPLLEKLPTIIEIAEIHKYEKLKSEEKTKYKKKLILNLGIVSTVVGIIVGVVKAFG